MARYIILLFVFINFLKYPQRIYKVRSFRQCLNEVVFYFLINLVVSGSVTFVRHLFLNLQINSQAQNAILPEIFSIKNLFITILLGPIIEEILFRFPLALYYNGEKLKFAYYFSAVVFAFIHIIGVSMQGCFVLRYLLIMIPLFFAGLILGFVRINYGIKFSILAHIMHNLFIMCVAFLILKM